MAKIAVLPPELASQIAAGEIAERPANVAKELIENALDAEASRCDVEVDGGGIQRLAISDDGHGMDEADARLCLERHATSKLSALADLVRVGSYGFRGEALPSIASVSRLTLRSRARGADAGLELVVEGGAAPIVRPIGVAVGTRVEVRDLFFNVPARRKFLRSSATEAGHVTEVVENAALSRPDVTFSLHRDGRKTREFLRVGGRGDRVRQVLPELEFAECRGQRGPLAIEAFLSRPEAARAGTAGLHVFVNGRPVRDRAVMATVAHAYGSVLERGRYPRGVVFLDLPLELVDVNVHPQKSEVRFADPRAVTDVVYGLLSRELARAFSLPPRRPPGVSSPIAVPLAGQPERAVSRPGNRDSEAPETSAGDPVPTLSTLPFPAMPSQPWLDVSRSHPGAGRAPVLEVREPHPDSASEPPRASQSVRWSSLLFVAQLRLTYLFCEGPDGLYLLDQHAAAERVTFTRLRRAYASRDVSAQALLFPVIVEVAAEQVELVERLASEIAHVGLDVRVRGGDTVSIHTVPKLLARGSPERLLRDLLAELSRQSERAFSDAVDLALATMACHGSIRAGDPIAPGEATALLHALDDADFAGHCPHGRPIVTHVSWAELERKVGRR